MKERKIVFVIPDVSDSHYKNRIIEFIEQGYDVEVFGFEREGHKTVQNLPYEFQVIDKIEDHNYWSRVMIYIKVFRKLGKLYKQKDICYFLGGLDIAMFFVLCNHGCRYVYEECDLMHTYTKMKPLLELIDKRIISKSLLTISTSEGFNLFHFGTQVPSQVCFVPNRLNPEVLKLPVIPHRAVDPGHLHVGFVGVPRAHTAFFIEIFCKNFPMHTFHLYGGPLPDNMQALKQYDNFVCHGFFSNPKDLPQIYASIDVVLCTYDNRYINPQYAEPNKLYDAIYFETPIIVSTNTFLSDKVSSLNVGYEVDPFNERSIVQFFKTFDYNDLKIKQISCSRIDKMSLINKNDHFFATLNLALI